MQCWKPIQVRMTPYQSSGEHKRVSAIDSAAQRRREWNGRLWERTGEWQDVERSKVCASRCHNSDSPEYHLNAHMSTRQIPGAFRRDGTRAEAEWVFAQSVELAELWLLRIWLRCTIARLPRSYAFLGLSKEQSEDDWSLTSFPPKLS